MTLSHMTKYFRQSLLDSENLSPSDSDVLPATGEAKQTSPKKLPFVALEKQVWLQGRVDVSFAKGLLGDKKTAEITMFPRVDLSRKQQQKPRVLLPLVVFAELNQQGELKPTQKEPLIPREWLAPNQGIHQPFAELAMLEHFYAKNPFEGIETWEQLQAYCHAMLCAVTQVAKAGCRRKMKVSSFSKVEMSPLVFVLGVLYESGDITDEFTRAVTLRGHAPLYRRVY